MHNPPAPGTATGGLKVLSAGSTLYGMRPAAETFTRGAGIPVAVATDHGHNIEKFALSGTADADVVVIPTPMMNKLLAAARADKAPWSRSARCGSAPPFTTGRHGPM